MEFHCNFSGLQALNLNNMEDNHHGYSIIGQDQNQIKVQGQSEVESQEDFISAIEDSEYEGDKEDEEEMKEVKKEDDVKLKEVEVEKKEDEKEDSTESKSADAVLNVVQKTRDSGCYMIIGEDSPK